MEYVYLGSTGVKVSELCFGTMTFGSQADRAESARLFSAAFDAGINFFDTADVYTKGESERILGELIRGRRDSLFIATKVHNAMSDAPNDRGSSRLHILKGIEASLSRLGTDYADLYYLHARDAHAALEDSVLAMDHLVRTGKILYWGLSNYAAWEVQLVLRTAERLGAVPPKVIQPMYSLVKRTAEIELFPMALYERLGAVCYSPLGAGLLTGKYLAGAQGRLLESEKYRKRYAGEKYLKAAEEFTELAKELGEHPASLAVAWVMAHPAVTCPIVGARNVGQLEPSLGACAVEMTPELYARVAALFEAPPPATDRSELEA